MMSIGGAFEDWGLGLSGFYCMIMVVGGGFAWWMPLCPV